jgi:hypothetical protein
MNNVHFTVGGSTFTYGGFYRGFGLSATVSMLFEAFLVWQLGALVREAPGAAAKIGWGLCLVQVAGVVLSVLYFSAPPAVFSLAVAACLGLAAWRSGTRRTAKPAAIW